MGAIASLLFAGIGPWLDISCKWLWPVSLFLYFWLPYRAARYLTFRETRIYQDEPAGEARVAIFGPA